MKIVSSMTVGVEEYRETDHRPSFAGGRID